MSANRRRYAGGMDLDRRDLLALGLGAIVLGPARALAAAPRRDWTLHDAAEFVEGRGWSDVERPYDRLPARAKETVRRAVWDLSRHSAGMLLHFETDATALRFEVDLLHAQLDMPHMPASGVSGLDLYGRDDDGAWRWVAATRPTEQRYSVELSGLRPGRRAYRLHLPLYNGVDALRIGIPGDAAFEGLAPRDAKPLVYHGTSIAHGACASRPGTSFVNQLGRRLEVPVLNLAFSGNGRLEMELAELLVELDARAHVLDCLPNLNAAQVAERTVPFVRRLREARPDVPIVLVEDRTNANARWFPSRAEHHRANHAALARAHAELVEAGVERLTYVADAPFLGHDGEGTVDGSHPNDLGMARYADALEPVLRSVLGR